VPRFISRLIGLVMVLAVIATPMLARGTVAQDAATPCPALTDEDAAAWATAWTTAWNSHDPANVVALYAPDAIHHWGVGVDSEGVDELTGNLSDFFTAFPGIHLTADRVWLAGDTVIIRWIAIGIQETDFMGIPASKDTATWTGINIQQIECGLTTESWSEADHFGRIEQQGVIPVGSPEAEATPAA
jgi:steroid delta-isomerase-like uncharacterized protein